MIVSAIAALSLAATGPKLPPAYIPKHPDLVIAEPVFNPGATLQRSKEVAAVISDALANEPQNHPDLAAFVGIAGGMYINAHRAQIMDCTDRRGNKAGPGMADPYCVWPRPMADDWVGCMALQFKGEEAFAKFKLSSVRDDETVFIWIDENYDTIIKQEDGEPFVRQLNGLAQLGAKCEQVVQNQVPEGNFTAKEDTNV